MKKIAITDLQKTFNISWAKKILGVCPASDMDLLSKEGVFFMSRFGTRNEHLAICFEYLKVPSLDIAVFIGMVNGYIPARYYLMLDYGHHATDEVAGVREFLTLEEVDTLLAKYVPFMKDVADNLRLCPVCHGHRHVVSRLRLPNHLPTQNVCHLCYGIGYLLPLECYSSTALRMQPELKEGG